MLRTLAFEQIAEHRSGFASPERGRSLIAPVAAVLEGLAASRKYQQLRTRGRSHDAAIREAFGMGRAHEQKIGSIYFAGRA